MSRIVDIEPLDCLAWKDGEHGTTFDDGVLWVLEKIGELPTIERKTDEWCSDCKEYDQERHCCPRFNRVIRKTLSEQRKTGKWMVDPDGRLHCSRCLENPTNRVMIDGKLVYDMTPIVGRMRYCPNCGAKMEVEE